MAWVVCVLVKICVFSISLYKLDTDKLTTPFELAHQFTLVCTVSDSKTVRGCHYNLCSNHSFVLTDYRISSNRMRALYLFQCFDIACIIQGRFVFEGALYFLPMKSYPEISLN